MSKRKKRGGNKMTPDQVVNLVTAVLNLTAALIILFERLRG